MSRRKRRAARAPFAPVGRGPCPTPGKRRYTEADARIAVATAADRGAPPLESYLCMCGGIHLTRKKPLEQRIRAALADGKRQR